MASLNEDTRFSILDFLDGTEPREYQYCKKAIAKYGYVNISIVKDGNTDNYSIKVYTAELATILMLEKIEIENLDKNEKVNIDAWQLLYIFADGYKEGQIDFEREFGVSNDTLFGAKGNEWIESIKKKYFHAVNNDTRNGWQFVKQSYPCIFTRELIRKYGYYSGAVSAVDDLRVKFPRIFKDFDKCEEIQPPATTDQTKDKKRKPITARALALFCSLIERCRLDEIGHNTKVEFCKRVCENYGLDYTEKVRQYFWVNMDIKKSDRNLEIIQTHILPKLPLETKDVIEQLIISKTKTFA